MAQLSRGPAYILQQGPTCYLHHECAWVTPVVVTRCAPRSAPRSATRHRIALVDDHALYREGLRAVLLSERAIEVVGDASTAREAIELVARTTPDLVVVDVRLPDQPGASLTRELRRMQPRCRILGLSMVETSYCVTEMLRAGAVGYAVKSQPTEEIVEAIRISLRGGRYLAPRLPRAHIEAMVNGEAAGPVDMLSPREREVFDLLIQGRSSERVAMALSIAPRTAETHRQNIMTKLGVHSIVDLVRLAAYHGLLGDPDA